MTAGLYIHIPFCVSKCDYCDFLSFPPGRIAEDIYSEYVKTLVGELRTAREGYLANTVFNTVYMGGGTPTALPAPFLRDILTEVRRFALTSDAEITVEANPGTLSDEKLSALKNGGANRLSFGLQAWQDCLLRRLGRTHTREEFVKNYLAARDTGFHNISVDLMFALPGQSMDAWRESLEQIISLNPEHVSAYSLTPEEGTPLWTRLENKELVLPDDDADREMYAIANKTLAERGYAHYELSNYARPGYESRHNTRYWKRTPYYGFGLGAHSFDGCARWRNTDDLSAYVQKNTEVCERLDYEMLSTKDAMGETMFLGLRLTEGVLESSFLERFGTSIDAVYGGRLERLCTDGLLIRSGGRIRLTSQGMDLANRVFLEFL